MKTVVPKKCPECSNTTLTVTTTAIKEAVYKDGKYFRGNNTSYIKAQVQIYCEECNYEADL